MNRRFAVLTRCLLVCSFLFPLIVTSPLAGQAMFSCTNIFEIPQVECEALVALFNQTDGQDWVSHTNWLGNNLPSSWYGVRVLDGRVVGLSLEWNRLTGTIPPELGNLTSLEYLYLSGNSLFGSIPSELGNLIGLETLELYANLLAGSIPSTLGNLSSLRTLWLSDNQLAGSIPPELGTLTNLEVLWLNINYLAGSIPPELGNLSNLSAVNIGSNRLTGSIPLELGNLSKLNSLHLYNNQLTGSIPSELLNLANLEWLELGGNQLTGSIPPGLSNLSNLKFLTLGQNFFTGTIPVELATLMNLEVLNLAANRLTGNIPQALGNLASLTYLILSDNLLTGAIPQSLGNLTKLNRLCLDQNQLNGDIPSSFLNLTHLSDPGMYRDGKDGLELDFNQLNIPAGYPNLTDPLHAFVHQKDPNWHQLQSFEQVVGSAGGKVTSLDGKTAIVIQPGAVSADVTFAYVPQPQPNAAFRGLDFAANSFQLTAQDGEGDPVSAFDPPLIVTITYSDADIAGLIEQTLSLRYWDPAVETWVDAATTCLAGDYDRDLDKNTFTLPVCHLSEFAVFSEAKERLYMPVVRH